MGNSNSLQLNPKEKKEDFKFFQVLSISNEELDASKKALLGFDLYCWNKIKPFAKTILDYCRGQNISVSELYLFGVPRGYFWERAKEYLSEIEAVKVNEQLSTSGLPKPYRKPEIYTGKKSNINVLVIRAPLGDGHTRLYIDCFRFFKVLSNINMLTETILSTRCKWSEEEKKQEVEIIKQFYTSIKNVTFKAISSTFFSVPDLDETLLAKHYEAFQKSYFSNSEEEKEELSKACEDASVFIGFKLDESYRRELATKEYEIKQKTKPFPSWKAEIYENSSSINKQKICFFLWEDSLLGETSEMVAYMLLRSGAKELLHFGCKVGNFVAPELVRKIFCPKYFDMMEHEDVLPQKIGIESSIYRFIDAQHQSEKHLSIPNPTYETFTNILDFGRNGTATVDDEGAFIGRAVWKCNMRKTGPKKFGAVYWASDVLLSRQQSEWFYQFEGSNDLNLQVTSKDAKEMEHLKEMLLGVFSKILLRSPEEEKQVNRSGTYFDKLKGSDLQTRSHEELDMTLAKMMNTDSNNYVTICADLLDDDLSKSVVKTFILNQDTFSQIYTIDCSSFKESIRQLHKSVYGNDITDPESFISRLNYQQNLKICLVFGNVNKEDQTIANSKELSLSEITTEWIPKLPNNVKCLIVTRIQKPESPNVMNISDPKVLSLFFEKLKQDRDRLKSNQITIENSYQVPLTITMMLSSLIFQENLSRIGCCFVFNLLSFFSLNFVDYSNIALKRNALTNADNSTKEIKMLLDLKNTLIELRKTFPNSEVFDGVRADVLIQGYDEKIHRIFNKILKDIQDLFPKYFMCELMFRTNLASLAEEKEKEQKQKDMKMLKELKDVDNFKPDMVLIEKLKKNYFPPSKKSDKKPDPWPLLYPFHRHFDIGNREDSLGFFDEHERKYKRLTFDTSIQMIITGFITMLLSRIFFKQKKVGKLLSTYVFAASSYLWLFCYNFIRFRLYTNGNKKWSKLRNDAIKYETISFANYQHLVSVRLQEEVYNTTNQSWSNIFMSQDRVSKLIRTFVKWVAGS